MTNQIAIFGAGCFWSPEYHFSQLPGVVNVTSGYAGGQSVNPSYEDVCTGRTGHAEVVQVEFDPEQISYEQLLDVFWAIHDPTQVNRQGPDVGTQYRSIILFNSPEQEKQALLSRDEEQATLKNPIATEIAEAGEFYPAEEYHQQYIERTGRFCHPPRRKYQKVAV
jgi:peptide-methionine (S)-S-oxide reductase